MRLSSLFFALISWAATACNRTSPGGELAAYNQSPETGVRAGGTHDTMVPKHMQWMATQVQNGSSLIYPNGNHCSMWDDQLHYFPSLIKFINGVNAGQTTNIL